MILLSEQGLRDFLLVFCATFILSLLVGFIVRIIANRQRLLESSTEPAFLGALPPLTSFFVFLLGMQFATSLLPLTEKYTSIRSESFFILYALFFAFLSVRLLDIVVRRLLVSRTNYKRIPRVVTKLVQAVVYMLVGLIILRRFAVDITPLVTTLGLGGLAIGLALKSWLENLFAGGFLLYEGPLQVGDTVKLSDGTEGDIEDINWRTTRILTKEGARAFVPNARLIEGTIINYSQPRGDKKVLLEGKIDYTANLQQVEEIMLQGVQDLQQKNNDFEKEPATVRFRAFTENGILFSLSCVISKDADRGKIKHELLKALKESLEKEGVQLKG